MDPHSALASLDPLVCCSLPDPFLFVAHVGTESEEVAAAVQSHRGWILEEVQAKTLSEEPQEYAETWEVGGATVELSLSKVEEVPTSS